MTRRVNLDTEITAAEWKMVARNGNRGEVDALRCRNMGRSPGCARAAADCCVKVNSRRFYYAKLLFETVWNWRDTTGWLSRRSGRETDLTIVRASIFVTLREKKENKKRNLNTFELLSFQRTLSFFHHYYKTRNFDTNPNNSAKCKKISFLRLFQNDTKPPKRNRDFVTLLTRFQLTFNLIKYNFIKYFSEKKASVSSHRLTRSKSS